MSFSRACFPHFPVAVAQGLIWGLMAIGVFITFKVLDLADLTVDGTMATGGAVCIVMMTHGANVWVAMLCAFPCRHAGWTYHRYSAYLYGDSGDSQPVF